jgi:thiol-disulfide isomerase/thioredoxin
MLVVAAVMAAMLALAACGGSSADTAGTTAGADIEIIAPEDFSVSDYAGKPLVVNVFGSWCPPCNSEAPDLAAFAEANPDTQFVGIAVNDQESDAVGFMNEYGLTYPLVIDDNRLAGEFGVTGVPTTVFFDAQGQEKDRIVGAASLDQFEAALATAK